MITFFSLPVFWWRLRVIVEERGQLPEALNTCLLLGFFIGYGTVVYWAMRAIKWLFFDELKPSDHANLP
ncbi:hypothetical protein JCM19000A_23430 [Silvimonas sp. JCM 19000]